MKKFNQQVNVRLTDEDVKVMDEINKSEFKGEANYAMICRYLIREGMKSVGGKNEK